MSATRLIITILLGTSAAALLAAHDVVRTADPIKRGLKESDFPRTVRVTDTVYTYEDFHAGTEKFTTTDMFVVTSEGVLVADGQGSPEATRGLVDAIRKVTDKPITYVVICSDHGDHTGGNASFSPDVTYILHPTSKAVLDHQAAVANARVDTWKLPATAQLVSDRKTLTLGNEEIQILFLGRAHTGGDLSVYLPRQRILFLSETFLNRVFPAMRSAYPSEWLGALAKAERMDVNTYIPGHGFTESAVVSREEIRTYHKALEAVIAEAKRLHAAGVPADEAVEQARFGEYSSWTLASSQAPIAIRKIYEELDGTLR